MLQFWFDERTPEVWFRKGPPRDRRKTERFGSTLAAAGRHELHELHDWPGSARPRP